MIQTVIGVCCSAYLLRACPRISSSQGPVNEYRSQHSIVGLELYLVPKSHHDKINNTTQETRLDQD